MTRRVDGCSVQGRFEMFLNAESDLTHDEREMIVNWLEYMIVVFKKIPPTPEN